MKKYSIFILSLLIIASLTGCIESNYLSLDSNLETGTSVPIYTTDQKVINIDSYSDNERVENTILPDEDVFLIEEYIAYHQSIFEMSKENRDESIEMWNEFYSNHADAIKLLYNYEERTAFEERLKIDVDIMKKANYEGQLFYDVDFDSVKTSSSGNYYIPLMVYMRIDNFDNIPTDDISLLVAQENNLKFTNVENHYSDMIDFYHSNEGKYITLVKGYLTYNYSKDLIVFPNIFNTVVKDANRKDFEFISSLWSIQFIEQAYDLNFISTTEFDDYREDITRKEFAKLIVLLYESTNGEVVPVEAPFKDTDDVYVRKAKAVDLMSGIGGDKFDPDSPLTREQIATVLSRYIAKTVAHEVDYSDAYMDNDLISSWAHEHVYKMRNLVIMQGYQNIFRPQDPITIEEAITTIVKNKGIWEQ